MEIIFLGTSAVIPTAKRSHNAVLLKHNSENILIDCGEGTQRQFRLAKQNPCKLTKILITHWHGDHVLGLPGLLQTLALNNYSKTLHIYGPQGTKYHLAFLLKMFVFVGKIKIDIHEIKQGKFLETKELVFEAFDMKHVARCLAYVIKEKDKRRIKKEKLKQLKISGPIVGLLQQGKNIKVKNKIIKAKNLTFIQPGKKVAFIFDTKINENCIKAAKNSDVLITEASFLSDLAKDAEQKTHLTAEHAAQIAKKSKSKKLILSHLSQRYDKNEQVILKEARKTFPNTILAYDFLKVKI